MDKRKNRSPIWKLPKDKLEELVKESDTMRQVLDFFGLNNGGGNHRTLTKRLKDENIDFSKFTLNFGKGGFKKKIPLEEVTVRGSRYARGHLKKRLIDGGILENKCCLCGLDNFWNNEKLVMVLDHINGINDDNRIVNLRLLCPNCNSQQDTFCGKKNVIKKNKTSIKNCVDCGKSISNKANRCKSCAGKKMQKNKIDNRPDKEVLLMDVEKLGYSATGRKYRVSDNAIRKWLK